MTDTGIRLEYRGQVALVTMDRPDKKNAFDGAMFEALGQTARILKKKLPRAIVLTGRGDAFCAGFDVGLDNPMTLRFLEAVNNKDKALAKEVIIEMRQGIDEFTGLGVPLIAAVNGLAYGGGAELASRCHIRVMDGGADLCFSEVRLGLMPDWGGGPALVRLVGPGRAADLILTARRVGAEEAARIGWAEYVSRKGNCLEQALGIAAQISRNGPEAVSAALGILKNCPDLSMADALEQEAAAAAGLIASGECLEGIAAFMEKRPPEF